MENLHFIIAEIGSYGPHRLFLDAPQLSSKLLPVDGSPSSFAGEWRLKLREGPFSSVVIARRHIIAVSQHRQDEQGSFNIVIHVAGDRETEPVRRESAS
jgi:hypothetical protein